MSDDPRIIPLQLADLARRQTGILLDTLGFHPQPSPFRIAHRRQTMTLRAYGQPDPAKPLLLIVPAPIKRSYVWDLTPQNSVIRACLKRGLGVYLVHWEPPQPANRGLGLSTYADKLLLNAAQTIATETGQDHLFLAGHSIGGTLAAIFASLHPSRVRGLILIESPLHFGPDVGDLDRLAARLPPIETILPHANVPGTLLDLASYLASPATFEWFRWIDWLRCLARPDPSALQTHVRAERWTLDEIPMPRQLLKELVTWLYREDRLLRGTLVVSSHPVFPRAITAAILSVIDRQCRIVPPQSMLPFHQAVGSSDTTALEYEGDVGVALQHLGPLIGPSAHRRLWPTIVQWIYQHN